MKFPLAISKKERVTANIDNRCTFARLHVYVLKDWIILILMIVCCSQLRLLLRLEFNGMAPLAGSEAAFSQVKWFAIELLKKSKITFS